MSLRVLHLLAPAPFGGLERVVAILAAEQRARGDHPVAALLLGHHEARPALADHLEAAGVTVHLIRTGSRAYTEQLKQLRALCELVNADLVHSHGYLPDVLNVLLRRKLDRPIVSTVHGFTGGSWRNRTYELIQRFALRHFDAVVAVSEKLARELVASGVASAVMRVVRNALPREQDLLPGEIARETLGIPRRAFSIGWVGRLSHEKGPDVLLSALEQLDGTEWVATLIGQGAEHDALRARATASPIGTQLRWPGAIASAGRYLRAFDVLVLSSRTEGTPMVLLEGMAAGIPLVTTAVGGIPDVVSTDEAILCPSEDVAALSQAIEDVRRRPDHASRRADRARSRFEAEYTADRFAQRYTGIYRDLIGSTNVHGR